MALDYFYVHVVVDKVYIIGHKGRLNLLGTCILYFCAVMDNVVIHE